MTDRPSLLARARGAYLDQQAGETAWLRDMCGKILRHVLQLHDGDLVIYESVLVTAKPQACILSVEGLKFRVEVWESETENTVSNPGLKLGGFQAKATYLKDGQQAQPIERLEDLGKLHDGDELEGDELAAWPTLDENPVIDIDAGDEDRERSGREASAIEPTTDAAA